MRREWLSGWMLTGAIVFCMVSTGSAVSFARANGEILAQNGNENAGRTLQAAGWRREQTDTGALHGGRLYGERQIQESSLSLTFTDEETGLKIPLPPKLEEKDILMENYYETQDILLIFPGDVRGFFENHVLAGNPEQVQEAYLSWQDEATWLRIRLRDVYEYQCRAEGEAIVLALEKPSDLYDSMVILDGDGGGEQVWDMMERVQARLEPEGIGVYCTGAQGRGRTEYDRAAFAAQLRADLVIGLRTASQAGEPYGLCILYNSKYFIPCFGNAQLALVLQQHTGGAYLAEGEEDPFLANIRVPAAALVMDDGMQALLAEEAYREKIADAIAEAIMEALAGIQIS